MLGSSSGSVQDTDTGIGYATRAAAAPQSRGRACKLLGSVALERGESDRAIEFYRVALQDLPEDSEVANNLAFLLSSRPDERKNAAALAATAVALAEAQRAPGAVMKNYLETQGVVELALGNCDKAKTAFEAGLRIDPTAVDLLIGLVESEECLRNLDEARRLLARVRDLSSHGSPMSEPLRSRFTAVSSRLEGSR
jgi:tetratricopeptide (TPR) repeat protein